MSKIKDESFVFIGKKPSFTRYPRVKDGSFSLYFIDEQTGEKTAVYEENKDYSIDYQNGCLMRLAHSRIPDFTHSVLYGNNHFDHRQAHESNTAYTVYGSYETEELRERIAYNGVRMKQTGNSSSLMM